MAKSWTDWVPPKAASIIAFASGEFRTTVVVVSASVFVQAPATRAKTTRTATDRIGLLINRA